MSTSTDEQLRRAARPTLEKIDGLAKGASEAMKTLLAELRKNLFTRRYTVTKLRKAIGASRWITPVFRTTVGLTPWRFIRESRLLTAARLLRDTSISVERIGLLVGYESCSAFQRAFVRWCGLCPSEFRDHAQEVREEMRRLPDDVLSWSFWDRYRRGELTAGERRVLLRYLEKIYQLTPAEIGVT